MLTCALLMTPCIEGELAEWEKFTNFELAARVPLIFHAPWLAAAAAAAAEAAGRAAGAGTAGGNPTPSAASSSSTTITSPLAVGRATRSFAELVDVYPTLVALALPAGPKNVARDVDGVSLVPAMFAPQGAAAETVGAKLQTLTQFPRCCLNASLPDWKFNDCDVSSLYFSFFLLFFFFLL